MSDTQRNFLILALIAVAGLLFSTEFGVGAATLMALISLAFLILMVYFAITIYHRNSGTIAQMDTTPRMVMQLSFGTMMVLLVIGMMPPVLPLVNVPLPYPVGFSRFGGSWTYLFWGGVIASGFGMWWAWQQRTSRW
jgi:hypothetical protein